MTFAPFARSHIGLHTDRVSSQDALRQERTAEEILRRLHTQPGVILADEVGMGKTFVALAVAASIIVDRMGEGGPIVVMVPSTLTEKWPRDWKVFQQKCLRGSVRQRLQAVPARSGVEFLKALDRSKEQKPHLIFLSHGALHRTLTDGFAKLAVIKRAFKGRSSLAQERRSFPKFAGRLLFLEFIEHKAPGLLGTLFERPYEDWHGLIQRSHDSLREHYVDDPVPGLFRDVLEGELERGELDPLVEVLRELPLRESTNLDARLQNVRRNLSDAMSRIWELALRRAEFKSPLLILDEAHHLKNPSTRLASLFVEPEAAQDSEFIMSGGALGGRFERMLFLTATPFQLGHAELTNVLERFKGVDWNSENGLIQRAEFERRLEHLRIVLDEAQKSALRLDRAWGRLTPEHLTNGDGQAVSVDAWWEHVRFAVGEGLVAQVVQHVQATEERMKQAQEHLSPWVHRQMKSACLPNTDEPRRLVLPGAAIRDGQDGDAGLEISDDVLLPFLLAGRAQALLANCEAGRALFAEGLASSFEAYLETRSGKAAFDESEQEAPGETSAELKWYLDHLDRTLPQENPGSRGLHPKILATAERAVALWRSGEKVLVFCHYRATGRALRQHISTMLDRAITELASQKLPDVPSEQVTVALEQLGEKFFDTDGSLRDEVTRWLHEICAGYPSLERADKERLVEVTRRFLRTPSFLVRYFDLAQANSSRAFLEAVHRDEIGGLSLEKRVDRFCRFLAEQCIPEERHDYLAALDSIQTGTHVGREAAASFDTSEGFQDSQKVALLPNVRLVNGEVAADTRRRLLLTFNTPLFPEILVASRVLAEGVDLHLNCRHVIHHDLDWNPSMIEQRTGRVDRLGCKAEQVGQPIHVYLPYVAATQDEKMYRVVRDRERWFQIIMGEKYQLDESVTEKTSRRIPLPEAVQAALRLRLHAGSESSDRGTGSIA